MREGLCPASSRPDADSRRNTPAYAGAHSHADAYTRSSADSNPTHEPVSMEVDVGDGEHCFWVEVVDTGEPVVDCNKLLINIYRDEAKEELFQTFDSWWAEHGMNCFSVEDVDFDGDRDLAVCNQEYRSFHWQSYYLWDEDRECFIEDPYGLNRLGGAEFDPESKTIKVSHGSVMSGGTSYYRYKEEALICIRDLSWSFNSETRKMDLCVTDGWNGEEITVYDHAAAMKELAEGMVGTKEFLRWDDLDYHGGEK